MAVELTWRSNVPGSVNEKVDEDQPLPVSPLYPVIKTFSYLGLGAADALGVVVNSTPCKIIGWSLSNHAVTERLVRVYDLGRKPVAATDNVSIKLRLALAATATGANSATFMPEPGSPCAFGLSFTITNVVTSDTDATAPTAGDVLVNIFYI